MFFFTILNFSVPTGVNANELMKFSRQFTKENFPVFLTKFEDQRFWTHVVQLGADEWRADWNFSGL